MATFIYKAVSAAGETLEGEIDAPSKNAVIEKLQRAGHIPLSATEKSEQSASRILGLFNSFNRHRISRKDITLFTRELSTLLEAGLALDHALHTLEELCNKPMLKKLTVNINERIKSGDALSTAMEAQGSVFDKLYLNTIRAGEAGGVLHSVLGRLADYLERSAELRNSVISALLYPCILLCISLISIFVLLSFVVPQFVPLFEDTGQSIPLLTQVIFSSAEFIRAYWWILFAVFVFIIWLIDKQLQDLSMKLRWDRFALKLPLYGELIAKLDVARFARTLGTLLTNGVPVLLAIEIVRDVIVNSELANTINEAAKALEQGRSLATPLANAEHFPALATQLIRVGEETGQLENMLLKTADIFEDESRTTIKRLLTILEPILILGLGFIIAVIIVSILLAILGLNELVI